MSENSNRPLTRREIREREQAAAAAAAAAAAPSLGGPEPTVGAPSPVPAPTPPAPAGPPSRRTLREQSGFTTSQAPVVRPPSATGGVRGVDETGRLTPVQRAGDDQRHETPSGEGAAGSRPSPPQRTSSRQPFTPPSSPWGPPPASATPSSPSLPWESPTAAQPPVGSQPPSGPQGAPARRSSPFDALVGSEHQPVRARAEAPVEDDEDDWDESEGSYTWLHYIILVVVAFVLGLLLWKLLLDGPDQSFESDQQAAAAVTTLHTLPDGDPL
jgi:hypothetical protein